MMALHVLQLSCFLVLFCAALAHPAETSDYNDYSLVEELKSQMATGLSCAGAGHRNGCCRRPSNCRVTVGSARCYCDRLCHLFRDCCKDIESIGCLPNTCRLARLSRGCCQWSDGNCYVRGGSCYCDRACWIFNDCCRDVRHCSGPPPPTKPPTTPPTTPSTTIPPTTPLTTIPTVATTLPTPVAPHNCVTLMAGQMGCCTGSACGVLNQTDNTFCYCNVECHGSKQIKCCNDTGAIDCYPQTCLEAGRNESFCCNSGANARSNCTVQTDNNEFCYCDGDCAANGGQNDCCTGHSNFCSGVTPAPQHVQSSQFMRMRQMADLMTNIPSRDWSEPRAANLWRRYQASLLAQLQEYYHERPQDFPFGK